MDIRKISDTYHAWRGELKDKEYRDIPGFCKFVSLEEIRKHESILTPGRYVGAEEVPDDTEQFDEKMKLLVAELHDQIDQGKALHDTIVRNLKELGYGD